MKKAFFFLLIAGLVIASCGKYEDGPEFSLMSKNARLVGSWNVLTYDTTTLGTNIQMQMDFNKDNTSKISTKINILGQWITNDVSGTWEWLDSKEGIMIIAQNDTAEFDITRLTSKELWMLDDENKKMTLEKLE